MPNRWKAKSLVSNEFVALGKIWRERKRLRRVILAKTDIKTAWARDRKSREGEGCIKAIDLAVWLRFSGC
jgi:hypothetical protein